MPIHPASTSRRYGIDRREFLRYLATVSAIPTLALRAEDKVSRNPTFKSNPFTLGVASGDPVSDGVVLWTRLVPEPFNNEVFSPTPIETRWEVAEDEGFQSVVQSGTALATPQLGYSVHVEVEGLKPHRWYFYRFHAGKESSPVGRTRTTPEPESMPERLRFAFTSCQHYETGYFNGYPHMQQEDLDLVVHLGDYIYEYAGIDNRVRKHHGGEIVDLNDYRNRYTQYRLDQDLQETHRLFPWLVTWDDHEFDNNCAGIVSEEDGVSPEEFLLRRLNAYQAYYEFMPLRRSSFPQGPDMKLYRSCTYGRLANFQILDTRQYRTDQPNGDHQKPLVGKVFDPQTTMLGREQENWLMSNLLQSTSTWNVLAQQVMMAPLNRGTPEEALYSMDQWPGYEYSRRKLLNFMHTRNIPNPIVLTGDIHTNWVNDLQVEGQSSKSPVVGTEFVGTSMNSGGNGGNKIAEFERAVGQNDFVHWHNTNRGYVSCEVTPETWTSNFRITPVVNTHGSPVETAASFVVEQGQPGAKKA